MTLATIALVSCSKDETTGINQGCGIEFRPAIGKTTRAAETTTANLKEIHVVAFNEAGERVFSDVFKKEADPQHSGRQLRILISGPLTAASIRSRSIPRQQRSWVEP